MPSLKESATNWTPKQIKTVAELPFISVDMNVLENDEAEYPYKYVIQDNEEYKVPESVLRDMKSILQEEPSIQKFKVRKEGAGLKTRYTVIPIP